MLPNLRLVQIYTFNSHSKKIKVIQLVTVLHDVALDLAGVDPGNEVLHVAGNQEGGIVDDFGSNADMTLLDESSSLSTG